MLNIIDSTNYEKNYNKWIKKVFPKVNLKDYTKLLANCGDDTYIQNNISNIIDKLEDYNIKTNVFYKYQKQAGNPLQVDFNSNYTF